MATAEVTPITPFPGSTCPGRMAFLPAALWTSVLPGSAAGTADGPRCRGQRLVPRVSLPQHGCCARDWHLRGFPPRRLLKLVLIAGLLLAIISWSVKSAWQLSPTGSATGGEMSRRSRSPRAVCTRVKGAAALSRYKICVTFKIKCLYGLRRESRCRAGVPRPRRPLRCSYPPP